MTNITFFILKILFILIKKFEIISPKLHFSTLNLKPHPLTLNPKLHPLTLNSNVKINNHMGISVYLLLLIKHLSIFWSFLFLKYIFVTKKIIGS